MRFVLAVTAALATPVLLAAKPPVQSAVPQHPDDKTIVHVLNRVAFGPRPGDVERVRRIGLAAYIEQQLHPESIPDGAVQARLAGFETLTKSSRDLAQGYYLPAIMLRRQLQAAKKNDAADDKPARTPEEMATQQKQRQPLVELSEQKVLRAIYSDRQLEEVMTDFWFNHFNVFAGKGATREYLTEYERDVIRPHVFGRFRDLLEATAKSPAMLFYLDNWQSAAPNTPMFFRPQQQQKRGLNENYGRELMELHTLGVDGGYTQKDVVEVARCFTGWTIQQPRQGGGFRFEPRLHDNGEKIVLGHRIKPGGGMSDGEQVLDILASHPSTARFIATKLVRRFVSDAPPPGLIDRASARFLETHGDIREVLRTILTSPEFFSAEAYRAKVKTPFEFVVSAVRAGGVDLDNALPLVQAVRQLGMPLYGCQPPTGYVDRADAWVNTGALLNRMNFALQLVNRSMRGTDDDKTTIPHDSAESVRMYFVSAVLANDVSPATTSTLAKAGDPRQAAALALGSPEFQRR
jgi:uncharacterized protein (DUF1800 family)